MIILIPSQPVLFLNASIEAANSNFIVFDLTPTRIKPTIYHTESEHTNHHTDWWLTVKIVEDSNYYIMVITIGKKNAVINLPFFVEWR